uniref:Uncharacterized protein n=1 Tax=Solanum lycopersicum TaxID=4081 RepID=A0A3Q7G931_SOLLC
MGACASKPKVLEGTAPHVLGEDIINNNKQEGIVGDDVPNKPHSLSNLFKEGKEGSEEVKEETSTEAQLPKTEETPENKTEDKDEVMKSEAEVSKVEDIAVEEEKPPKKPVVEEKKSGKFWWDK